MGIWGDMCVFVFKRQDEIRMKLIVNADDLGYSPHRDRGIFQAFYKGIVTSASLVVNGASSEQAVKEALSVGLEMGLHLNLTEGKPLTNVPSMVNTEGMMHYKMKFSHHPVQKEDVQRETIAQLERFKELTGSYPHHVDGHQHAHIVPKIPTIIAPILQQYGVSSTRIPDQDLDKLDWIEDDVRTRYELRYLSAVNARLIYRQHGIRAPECFVGVGLCGTQMTPLRIKESLQGTYGTVELMVHPGHSSTGEGAGCGVLDDFDTDEGRKHECIVLCSMNLTQFEMTTWQKFAT